MARIKVTGYMETDGFDPSDLDLSDPSGLSESGFLSQTRRLSLDDLEFELVDDDD